MISLLLFPLFLSSTVDAFGDMGGMRPGGPPGQKMPQQYLPPAMPPIPDCTWLEWSACDRSCNGGKAYRTRIITPECAFGPSHQLASCNTQPCPQDCVLSEWTEFSCGAGCCGCSAPCGGGIRSRMRQVLAPALFGGSCDLSTVESEPCNTQGCPSDCVITSMWSEYGACSAQCGGGYQNRTRSTDFVTVARPGPTQTRKDCPPFFQERSCGNVPCPPQEPQEPQKQKPLPPIKVQPPVIVQPSVIPPFVSAPPNKQDPKFCQSRADGGYSKPECRCCRDFNFCFQRTLLTKWCPPGQVWEDQWKKCMDASAAGCSQKSQY